MIIRYSQVLFLQTFQFIPVHVKYSDCICIKITKNTDTMIEIE